MGTFACNFPGTPLGTIVKGYKDAWQKCSFKTSQNCREKVDGKRIINSGGVIRTHSWRPLTLPHPTPVQMLARNMAEGLFVEWMQASFDALLSQWNPPLAAASGTGLPPNETKGLAQPCWFHPSSQGTKGPAHRRWLWAWSRERRIALHILLLLFTSINYCKRKLQGDMEMKTNRNDRRR